MIVSYRGAAERYLRLALKQPKALLTDVRNQGRFVRACCRRNGAQAEEIARADGMPGLVAAEATDALGTEPGGAGAGLVLDGDGLRRLRAVVMRLRDGDAPGPGR